MDSHNRYGEVFQIEMEGWSYGLSSYPGDIFPELVFRVLRELEPSFIEALQKNHPFDILAVSKLFSKSAKYLVHEKDIAFCILSLFPAPSMFNEEAQFTMACVIDQVEKEYGGALERMNKKWQWEAKAAKELEDKKEAENLELRRKEAA